MGLDGSGANYIAKAKVTQAKAKVSCKIVANLGFVLVFWATKNPPKRVSVRPEEAVVMAWLVLDSLLVVQCLVGLG